ncbi:transposase-like protein [Hirsutella rhossiliensis]
MSSSRDTSPVSSVPQSFASRPHPTPVNDKQTRQMLHNANLTLIGRTSGTAANDFGVVGTKIKESWIYRYGANLEHSGVRYWLCRISPASSAPNHGIRRESSRIEDSVYLGGYVTILFVPTFISTGQPSYQLASHFDERTWKARFVDWVIVEDVTFRQASSERLGWLVSNGGELATFERRQQIVFDLVKNAKSSVHTSFDLWTASNAFNYVGIVGHFNIAAYLKESNDTCLETLARWFPMDVSRRRLRCIGHVINLVVRAVILAPTSVNSRLSFVELQMSSSSTFGPRKELSADSTTLPPTFDGQISDDRVFGICRPELAGDDPIFTLEIVVDGKTRWNSIYMMIKRVLTTCRLTPALELRCAIELYQSRWQKPKNDPDHRDLPVTNDFLNAGDWVELERFYEFLKPFYILTKTIEGNASAVWETLKTMDYLFMKFKQAAEDTQFEEASHFKSGIDCGWAKLEDYYVKTDRTPVYRAALALHPSYGYDYFERHWKKAMNKPQWYSDMQSAVGSLFDEYRRQTEVETQAQAGFWKTNPRNSFGKRSISSLNTQRKKVKAVSQFTPKILTLQTLLNGGAGINWNTQSLLNERVFSQTKKMITDERNQLSPEIVEADQLQKQWLMRGPTGPPTQTDLDRQTDSHGKPRPTDRRGRSRRFDTTAYQRHYSSFSVTFARVSPTSGSKLVVVVMRSSTETYRFKLINGSSLLAGRKSFTLCAVPTRSATIFRPSRGGVPTYRGTILVYITGTFVPLTWAVVKANLTLNNPHMHGIFPVICDRSMIRPLSSLNRLVDELKQRRRRGQDRGQGQGQIRVQAGTRSNSRSGPSGRRTRLGKRTALVDPSPPLPIRGAATQISRRAVAYTECSSTKRAAGVVVPRPRNGLDWAAGRGDIRVRAAGHLSDVLLIREDQIMDGSVHTSP